MPKLYTTVPGAEQTIGNCGVATNEVPALVPEEVAAEFDGRDGYRVEREEIPAAPRLRRKPSTDEPKEE